MKDQMEDKQADAPLDQGTRLAFERTYLAHERTQMAWVRTSVGLISFGFVIAKVYHHLHAERPERTPLLPSSSIGILMIAIGLIALVLASVQHGRALKSLRAQCPGLQPSLAWVMVTMLALLGILALAVAWVRE
jgi:putative membrane protein